MGRPLTTIEGAAATPPGGDEATTTTTTEGSSSSQTTSSTLAKDGKRRPRPATADATTTTFGQQATSTSTTTTCRNSTDPACGPVYWDPPPEPNQPLTVQVTSSPAEPRAGEIVTFHVVVEDPDAEVYKEHNQERDWGDGTSDVSSSIHGDSILMYGPWTPPSRNGSRHEASFEHVYSEPGTYTARFSFASFSGCAGRDPYGSQGQATVTVTVRP